MLHEIVINSLDIGADEVFGVTVSDDVYGESSAPDHRAADAVVDGGKDELIVDAAFAFGVDHLHTPLREHFTAGMHKSLDRLPDKPLLLVHSLVQIDFDVGFLLKAEGT